MQSSNKITYFSFILLFLLFSCKTETKVDTIKMNSQLSNNKLLEVIKTETVATRIGVFTNHEYVSFYSFKYQFKVKNKEVVWKDNGNAVPKNIIYCNDSVYIKYLYKKSIPYQETRRDTIKITNYRDTIVDVYAKYIDKRYFFKWFGKTSWKSISKKIYDIKKSNCKEDSIPNDNDFKDIINKKKGYVSYEIFKDSVIYHYVFYNGINLYKAESHSFKVKDAYPKSFIELSNKYAKDSLHVFHKGHKIRKRDLTSFRVLNRSLTIDKYGVYFDNKIIKGSHGLSFKFIDDRYGIDNNQMYFLGRNFYTVLKGVDKKSAKIVDCKTCSHHYVMDKNHVYYNGTLINKANVKAFTVMDYDYSKDNKHIFYNEKMIKEADYNSFEILKEYEKEGNIRFYAEDINNKYGVSSHNNELIIQKK